MASVTLPALPARRSSDLSRAVTSIAGVMLAPATVLVGCTVNTSVPALPAVMLKPELVPVRSELHTARVQPLRDFVSRLLPDKANPPVAAWVAVLDKTPPDG